LVFVSGGKDPWSPLGLEVPPESALIDEQDDWSVYEASYGQHFHVPEGFHGPESSSSELAHAVWRAAFEMAGVELPGQAQASVGEKASGVELDGFRRR
jgi:hypothetical protein